MENDDSFDMASPDRLLSSILFIRPPKDNNAILIVEGNTDIKFYNSFVNDEKYVILSDVFDNFDGIRGGKKDKVIETIKMANKDGIKGIIGIVDADFDNLLDGIHIVDNLYRTDTHDLESMLLKSKKPLKKILKKYHKANHLITDTHVSETQTILLETSKYIGCALWCSNECQWMIDFENFPINICIDDKCNLDFEKTYDLLKRKSSEDTLSLETIESKVSRKVSENNDLWQICRGKEMLRVLAMYIKHNIKSGNYGYDNLRDDFILAFNEEDFKETILYMSMKEWEQQNENFSLIKF